MSAKPETQATQHAELAYLLHDVARLMRREFDRRLRELGLTRAQWTALAALLQQNGLKQTELAFMLDMARAPLGTLVDRLERDGWVRRKPDPEDGRANRLYITDKINPLMEEFTQANLDVYQMAIKGLSAADLAALPRALARMKANLGTDSED